MFLFRYKKKTNGVRNKRTVLDYFIKKKNKITKQNCVITKKDVTVVRSILHNKKKTTFIGVCRNKFLTYKKKLNSMLYNGQIITHNYLKYKTNNKLIYFGVTPILCIKVGSIFNSLINPYNYTTIQQCGSGSYITYMYNNMELSRIIFRLPSGRRKSFGLLVFGLNGVLHNVKKKQQNTGKSINKKNVRGIAMNPVDHCNGGSSKVKKPFMNKYNKIARAGK